MTVNVGKWMSELTKAQALDCAELDQAMRDVSTNSQQMLKVQSLSKPELRELLELFEVNSFAGRSYDHSAGCVDVSITRLQLQGYLMI